MAMKPMNPVIMAKLIEGHKNVVGQLAAEREKFYQNQTCPRCGSDALQRVADPRRMIVQGEALPRYQLHCLSCECTFDPFTGLIEKLGNLAKAFEPAVPLLNRED